MKSKHRGQGAFYMHTLLGNVIADRLEVSQSWTGISEDKKGKMMEYSVSRV